MEKSWQEAYKSLLDFIKANPSIQIRMDMVVIPPELNKEFYGIFDAVLNAFMKEKYQNYLDQSEFLSRNYAEEKDKFSSLLQVENIPQAAAVQNLLDKPIKRLTDETFIPLFDVLKGKINLESFEQQACFAVETAFARLYKLAYEKWLILSLSNLLVPDKLFSVGFSPKAFNSSHTLLDTTEYGKDSELLKMPVESRKISFNHIAYSPFILPDFIVHSKKIHKYVASRSDIDNVAIIASNPSRKREWLPLKPIKNTYGNNSLQPGLLIYLDKDLEELTLVADFEKICRPDIILEGMSPLDWYDNEKVSRIAWQHVALKPKLGSFVVNVANIVKQDLKALLQRELIYSGENQIRSISRETVTSMKTRLTEIGITLLTVGFDKSKLKPIIDAMNGKYKKN